MMTNFKRTTSDNRDRPAKAFHRPTKAARSVSARLPEKPINHSAMSCGQNRAKSTSVRCRAARSHAAGGFRRLYRLQRLLHLPISVWFKKEHFDRRPSIGMTGAGSAQLVGQIGGILPERNEAADGGAAAIDDQIGPAV